MSDVHRSYRPTGAALKLNSICMNQNSPTPPPKITRKLPDPDRNQWRRWGGGRPPNQRGWPSATLSLRHLRISQTEIIGPITIYENGSPPSEQNAVTESVPFLGFYICRD